MIEKTVTVNDKEVKFKSSATIPRLYRIKFKRDIFKDLAKLEKSFKVNEQSFEIEDLEIFENVAYIMAYHADKTIPPTIDEWLDEFEMFSIYEILPEILKIWGNNLQTDIQSKKTWKNKSWNDNSFILIKKCWNWIFGFTHDWDGARYVDRKSQWWCEVLKGSWSEGIW